MTLWLVEGPLGLNELCKSPVDQSIITYELEVWLRVELDYTSFGEDLNSSDWGTWALNSLQKDFAWETAVPWDYSADLHWLTVVDVQSMHWAVAAGIADPAAAGNVEAPIGVDREGVWGFRILPKLNESIRFHSSRAKAKSNVTFSTLISSEAFIDAIFEQRIVRMKRMDPSRMVVDQIEKEMIFWNGRVVRHQCRGRIDIGQWFFLEFVQFFNITLSKMTI